MVMGLSGYVMKAPALSLCCQEVGSLSGAIRSICLSNPGSPLALPLPLFQPCHSNNERHTSGKGAEKEGGARGGEEELE